MKFNNHQDNEVDVKGLDDKTLVTSYRWYLNYFNVIKKHATTDAQYQGYVAYIGSIKDDMKNEIKVRKLKMSHYDSS